MSTIFISHSSADDEKAAEIRDWLRRKQVESLFLDFDPEDGIPPGRNWERELYRRLRQCRAMIVLCSESSMASSWCFAEITLARALGKELISIKLESCTLHSILTDRQVIDMTHDTGEGYRRLWNGLVVAGLDPTGSFRWDERRSPYPGLLAYEEEDAAVFFGRDESIREALDTLNTLGRFSGRRLVLFLGASGSGKSSLVRAGLAPRLKRDMESWVVVDPFRPGQRPFDGLAAVLTIAFEHHGEIRDRRALADQLKRAAQQSPPAGGVLIEFARDLGVAAGRDDATVVFAIDQFEELLYANTPEQNSRFLTWLRTVLDRDDSPLMVLATLRSDFLADFQNHPALRELPWEQIMVGPLSIAGYRQVIEGPAEVAGVDLEHGLTELMIKNTETEDALPLLAFTLRKLWEASGEDKRLKIEMYRDKLGGLEGAVRRAADTVMHARMLSPEQEDELRRAFLAMTRLNEKGQYARRAVRWTELPAGTQGVLRRFVEARLLVSGKEEGTVEIAHEALLRTWPRLKMWLDDDRELLRRQQRFEVALNRWKESRDFVLEGVWLAEAEALAAQEAIALGDRDAQELLRRSREARDAERQRELDRTRELEQALGNAERQLAVSESQRLAFAAREASTTPETALLLTCEAVQWDRNPLSEEVLRDSLDNVHWNVTGYVGHTLAVNSAVLSRDGQRILTASDDRTARLWDTNGHCLEVYDKHSDRVTSAVFSPDERTILTTSKDGTARLWNIDGDQITELKLPPAMGSRMELHGDFSSDGQYVLVGDKNQAWLGDIQDAQWQASWGRDRVTARLESLKKNPSADRTQQEGHTGRVYSAAFSPDGQRVVTASEDYTARIWDLSGRQLAILRGHQDEVIKAMFSPDGQRILTGSNDKTARLWKATGEPLQPLRGHTADVGHLAFSSDGQLMLTAVVGGGHVDTIVRLWDYEGHLLAELKGHTEWITSIGFSPDSRYILTASADNTVRLWDLEGHEIVVFQGHLDQVVSATFTPDSNRILTASADGMARLWEHVESPPLPTISGHGEAIVTAAIYNADGTHILTSSFDDTICLWDANSQRIRTFGGVAHLLTPGSISPDGRYLLTTRAGHVHVWQLPFGIRFTGEQGDTSVAENTTSGEVQGTEEPSEPLATFPIPGRVSHGDWPLPVFSSDGRRILVATGGAARLYERDGSMIKPLEGPAVPVMPNNLAPLLQRYKEAGIDLPSSLDSGSKPVVDFAMFSPDSQRVLTASQNGMVWLWSMDGNLLTSFLADMPANDYANDNVFSVTFSPDGRRILTTKRRQADLWDRDGHHLATLPCNTNKVKQGIFSPDGQRIVTVAESAIPDVRLWDGDGQLITALWNRDAYGDGPRGYLNRAIVQFDNESTRLYIVDGNIVRIWDRDGQQLTSLTTATDNFIKYVEFSPDREQLLTASYDGTAQLWEIRNGKLMATFKGHEEEVNSAVFSGNGRRVVTASSDGKVRQFLVDVDDLLTVAARRVARRLNAREIARFNVPTPLRFDPTVEDDTGAALK